MGNVERRDLIKDLEDKRESRVITYVTGDRQPPVAGAQIADDAVRPIFEVESRVVVYEAPVCGGSLVNLG